MRIWGAGLALVGAAALAAGGAYVAARIRDDALRVQRSGEDRHPLIVRAFSDEAVRADPGTVPTTPALVSLGLRWAGGQAQMGPVERIGPGAEVTRSVVRSGGERPSVGTRAKIVATPWGEDPHSAHGLPFEEIRFPAPGGTLPGWWVPGGETCAIIVHGRGADRPEGLRLLKPISDAGLSALIIAYRNDPGTPTDGIARFGQTEWEDLDAAAAYARSRGARRIVPAGISMGGAIAMAWLERRDPDIPVPGVILDSPVLNLRDTIEESSRRVLGPAARLGLVGLGRRLISRRFAIDWDAIDYLSRAGELTVPILLFHDREDRLIPVTTSDALAARRPDLVTYVTTRGAGHTLSWNAGPERYDAAVTTFLSELAP